jgi:hypothetical protein
VATIGRSSSDLVVLVEMEVLTSMLIGDGENAGYCEGELCCIETAVGAEYIGVK